ncbi:hypothetical protein [Mariniluteicoccus flavus]
MWTRLAKGIAVAAGLGLLTGGMVGCGQADASDTLDRRYCVEVATDKRVEDRLCEPDNDPAYAWVWVERQTHRPGHGYAAHYPTYRYPIDESGRRVEDRRRSTPRTTVAQGPASQGPASGESKSWPTYPRTQQTSGPQDPAPTKRSTTSTRSDTTTRGSGTGSTSGGSKSGSMSGGSKSGSGTKSGGSAGRR